MKKSGLADSPFFSLSKKDETTSPSKDSQDIISGNKEDNRPKPEVDVLSDYNKEQTYSVENQAQFRTNERSDVRTDDRTDIVVPKTVKRRKIRHAFDIFEDQLQSLLILQLRAVQKGRKKPKLGKMAQEAFDLYLKKKLSKSKQG